MPILLLLSGCQEAGGTAAVVNSVLGGGGGVPGAGLGSGDLDETADGATPESPSLALISLESTSLDELSEEGDEEGDGPPYLDETDPSGSFNEEIVDETETSSLAHAPEPCSLLLFGSGLLGSAFLRSRSRKTLKKP